MALFIFLTLIGLYLILGIVLFVVGLIRKGKQRYVQQ